jgi:hypothetical protein
MNVALANGFDAYLYAGPPTEKLVTWSSPDADSPRPDADHRLVWAIGVDGVFLEESGIHASEKPDYGQGVAIFLIDALTGAPLHLGTETKPVICATVSPPNEHCPVQ